MYESLTAAEKLVMMTIWNSEEEISLSQITHSVNETYGKKWKPQTVSTFIAKIVQKGFIKMKREGRKIVYEILISMDDYRAQEAQEFVKLWHKGSVVDFVRAYADKCGMTPEEKEEIKGLL